MSKAAMGGLMMSALMSFENFLSAILCPAMRRAAICTRIIERQPEQRWNTSRERNFTHDAARGPGWRKRPPCRAIHRRRKIGPRSRHSLEPFKLHGGFGTGA